MGGGIHEDQHAWVIMPTIVDDKQFGIISTEDKGCKRFVCNDFKMMHHIKNLRNKKVYELMLQTCKEKRTNRESFMSREVYDSLPSVLTVDAATTSRVTSVNVLPSWQTNEALQIEITQSNLDLLLEEPPAEPAPWTPTIEPMNVYWIASRKMVQCKWWDSKK